MNIVTGYRGVPHITANEQQAFNQGIFGGGNCVLNVGQKFAATLVDALTVTIADGEGVIQGVHFRIAPGDTDTVSISPGTTGYKRIDYICARYSKNASTGIESVDLVVVEGTPDASTPTAPTINTGDILTGSSPVDFPLWEVDLDGLTPSLTSLINVYSLSDCYNLPFTLVTTKMSSNAARVTVIPSIRMMILNIYGYNDSGSSVTNHVYMKDMPPISNLYSSCRIPILLSNNSAYSVLEGMLYNVTNDNDEIVSSELEIIGTIPNGGRISGSIALPFLKFTDLYPLSSATKV